MAELLTSAQNPKFKRLVALREKSRLRRDEGVFVVEGRRELEHCVEAGFEVETVFVCSEGAPPSGVRPSGSPHHPFGTVPPLSHRGCDVPQGEHLPDSPSPAPLLFGGFSPFSAEDPLDVGCTPQESLAALLNHLRELLPSVSDAALMRLLR